MSQSRPSETANEQDAAPVLAATNDPALKRILERIDTLGLTSNLLELKLQGYT
ncbi:MAG: hypothetical protein HOC55_09805, partial [Porticoccaceae bacterium]|nr:hypothetical protein [Porticoccaceae bacterium]